MLPYNQEHVRDFTEERFYTSAVSGMFKEILIYLGILQVKEMNQQQSVLEPGIYLYTKTITPPHCTLADGWVSGVYEKPIKVLVGKNSIIGWRLICFKGKVYQHVSDGSLYEKVKYV